MRSICSMQDGRHSSSNSNIPEKWVLLGMDFGENYNCHYQDEAQSANWSYKQATIHPMVTYYRYPDCGCHGG